METAVLQISPFMKMVELNLETDAAKIEYQPDSKVLVLIETV